MNRFNPPFNRPIGRKRFTTKPKVMKEMEVDGVNLFAFAEWFRDNDIDLDSESDQFMIPSDYRKDDDGVVKIVYEYYTHEKLIEKFKADTR